MSHVVKVKTRVQNLATLKRAVEALGMKFHEGVKSYAWWGYSVGDYPLPEGFKASDLGKCEHMISVPGASYQVGVVKARDEQGGYTLLWDFYRTGGLTVETGNKIMQAYAAQRVTESAFAQGQRVMRRETLPDGSIRILVQA